MTAASDLPAVATAAAEVRAQAARRRTFAVISAGHIHGKAGRKSTVSEKARAISITPPHVLTLTGAA